MTPEERAAAFVREHRGFDSNGDIWFIACDRAEANLASAIREAEDAALERAAALCEEGSPDGRAIRSSPYWALTIRSLKSTKD